MVGDKNWLDNARYVNDSWAATKQQEMGYVSPSRRWVHLYLNGLYWGIYTLTERPDEGFMAAHFGGKKKDYDVLNSNRLRSGSRDRFDYLRSLVRKPEVTEREVYEKVEAYLDIDSLIDYILYNVYACNVDWPSRNYWAVGLRSDWPKFRFMNWDAEIGFFKSWEHPWNPSGLSSMNFDLLRSKKFKEDSHGAGYFYKHLRRNPEFVIRFLDRLYFHTGEGGCLSPKSAQNCYLELLSEVHPLLFLESARWGDSRRSQPFLPVGQEWDDLTSPESWLRSEFFPNRSRRLIDMFKDDGIEAALLAPRVKRDKSFERVIVLENPNSIGDIYVTTDGRDPRASWTGEPKGEKYSIPLEGELGKKLKARVYGENEWSPLFEISQSSENN